MELIIKYSNNYKTVVNFYEVSDWMRSNYIMFNTLFFNKILPPTDMIIFEPIVKDVKYMGCAYNTMPYKIRLNFIYSLSELEWQNVLLHEMIHIWQFVMGYKGGHGKSFIMKAKDINRGGLFNVTTKYENIFKNIRYAKENR